MRSSRVLFSLFILITVMSLIVGCSGPSQAQQPGQAVPTAPAPTRSAAAVTGAAPTPISAAGAATAGPMATEAVTTTLAATVPAATASAQAAATAPAAAATSGPAAANLPPDSENKIIIYTARDKSIFDYVVPKFEERYPEYKGQVQVLNMGAQQVLERVRAEKDNPQADVWWGGTQRAFQVATQEGLLAPITGDFTSRIPAQYRDQNNNWVGEILLPEVIMYNTDALKPQDVPQDWDGLIDPKWQGKILIRNVQPSGTMRTIYSAMIDRFYKQDGNPNRGYDWLRKLDANTKEYVAEPTTLYLKLSRQEGVLSLWNLQDILIQKETNHLPFGYVIAQSGVPILVDGIGAIKGAKHPNGAQKFISFLFDEQIRSELAAQFYQIPVTPLSADKQPDWMKNLNLKPMDLQWDVMAQKEAEWIGYWDQNIKGRGGK